MFKIENFPSVTSDVAVKIVTKHICAHIAAGIHWYIDHKDDKDMLECLETGLFPEWYNGDKLAFIKEIARKIEDGTNTYELSSLEKLVLMNCLHEWYEDDYMGNDFLPYSLANANKVWNIERNNGVILGSGHIRTIKDAGDRMIVLTDIIETVSKDAAEDIEDFFKTVELLMSDIEDLEQYENLFADTDYELLMEVTPENMISFSKTHPELGIDVSNLQ